MCDHTYIQGFSTALARRRSSYPPFSSNLVLTHPILRAAIRAATRSRAPYQTFRDNITCLSRATRSRKTLYRHSGEAHLRKIFQTQPSCHRLSTNRLSRMDTHSWCHLSRVSPTSHPPKNPLISYPKTIPGFGESTRIIYIYMTGWMLKRFRCVHFFLQTHRGHRSNYRPIILYYFTIL